MTGALTEIRLVGGARGFNWLPIYVAQERGLFEKHGIALDVIPADGLEQATDAVRDGEADLTVGPPEGAIADCIAGGGLRVIAANAIRLPMSVVARPGIDSLADLRGKRIGTSSLREGTAIYTQVMLEPHGLHYPGDYEFVMAGIHTTRWNALQNGEIDCAPQPAPWNFLAEDNGFNRLAEVSDAIPELIFAAILGRKDWLEANKDAVTRFLLALAQAHAFANDPANEDTCVPIFRNVTTRDSESLARRGFAYMRDLGMWPPGLAVPDRALETTVDLMIRTGLLDEAKRDAALGVFDGSYLAAMGNGA